jgi:2-polyprenyl-6-hydroxyphenyl methylase / 3-demethylubiquinone-9 3-methyltransferase
VFQMAEDQNLRDLYEKDYVEKFEREQSPFRIARLIQYTDLPKDSHVADFGCGNGLLLACLHDQIRTYSGVDFSEHFIIAARNRQKMLGIANAEFFCESIGSFCSRNHEKFDAGFILDLAEHVPDKEWPAILSAIHSSIKPGGRLYVHTPNAEFFLEIMKKKNFIFHQFEEHVAVRDISRNTRMLEDAGFFNVDVKLLPHYNILRYMHYLSFFPIIGKYFKARIFIIAEK